jgi:Fe-S-cluster containining protein
VFPCNGCGACCRLAGKTGLVPSKPDGSCVFLAEDDSCLIYEARPSFCRVDERKPPGVSVEEWYRQSARACNELQEKLGMPVSFRMRVPE